MIVAPAIVNEQAITLSSESTKLGMEDKIMGPDFLGPIIYWEFINEQKASEGELGSEHQHVFLFQESIDIGIIRAVNGRVL